MPATKFRFDANGQATSDGHTVRNPALVGSVTVTFTATPVTPVAGTPPTPIT
ncbi:unannotated protein [freshwater metagenome]|uniref:Unannotated protein n=1 Tax=freshwater metagenome TaxID=449393 RepID=A0A6J6WTP0_9ZZZZ